MRVSPGRAGGFKSCAAQSGRVESLTRPQKFWPPKGGRSCHSFPPRQPTIAVRRPAYTVHSAPNQSGHYFRELDSAAIVAPVELLTVLSPAFSIRQTRARRGGRV